MPRRIPAIARGASRSPSTKEMTTGMATAQTAVVGATTAILPMASARYSSATPIPPIKPAKVPQSRSAREGDAAGSSGRSRASRISPLA
jgi:hypothetical protein